MPSLIDLVADKSIEQIVAICGDGKLRDDSICSTELRKFLERQSVEKLGKYAQYCLDQKFENSGYVLQDVVNEIGRRLGYQVTNGRYAGTRNDVGFDGLWFDGTNHIVVEVKTTDAYRINLDTIRGYVSKLGDAVGKNAEAVSTLIVVGRQDTGDLEAQIRGSKHAWSVRLISVEALSKLMYVNEEFDEIWLSEKAREILRPFEYTRVDHIVDLVFETQQETEIKTQAISDNQGNNESSADIAIDTATRTDIEAKRTAVVGAFFVSKKATAVRVTRSTYEDSRKHLHVVCAVSKRYKSDYQPYWYALHPYWLKFLEEGQESYFVLACMDRNEAFAIPLSEVKQLLPGLAKTEKEDRLYWHVVLNLDDGVLKWNLSRLGRKFDLSPYRFPI